MSLQQIVDGTPLVSFKENKQLDSFFGSGANYSYVVYKTDTQFILSWFVIDWEEPRAVRSSNPQLIIDKINELECSK
jgi:hypothetical protein